MNKVDPGILAGLFEHGDKHWSRLSDETTKREGFAPNGVHFNSRAKLLVISADLNWREDPKDTFSVSIAALRYALRAEQRGTTGFVVVCDCWPRKLVAAYKARELESVAWWRAARRQHGLYRLSMSGLASLYEFPEPLPG